VNSREQMNELIRVEEQLKSKKKRLETMESLISNREQQIETLREMNKSLQEEKDMVIENENLARLYMFMINLNFNV
jgi:hypothetical protein